MSKSIPFHYAEHYPTGPIIKFDSDDVAYLQEHIRTYRAINTGSIDGQQGKYYDAAVTLLDVFQYMPFTFVPAECDIQIVPSEITSLEFSGVIFDKTPLFTLLTTQIPITLTLQYTNKNCLEGIPGYYTITIMRTDTGRSIMIGDAGLQHVATHAYVDGPCFVANRNALRYCECFPSPCILRDMIVKAWTTLTKETDNNDTDQ